MIITNCPKCGSFNVTTAGVCANCGWTRFPQVMGAGESKEAIYNLVGELEIKMSGKALLDDYKRLLFESNSLTARIAELEAERRWIPVGERLPELDQEVLVYDQRGDITIDYLVALNREGAPYYTNSDDGALYWMPLPTPPEATHDR